MIGSKFKPSSLKAWFVAALVLSLVCGTLVNILRPVFFKGEWIIAIDSPSNHVVTSVDYWRKELDTRGAILREFFDQNPDCGDTTNYPGIPERYGIRVDQLGNPELVVSFFGGSALTVASCWHTYSEMVSQKFAAVLSQQLNYENAVVSRVLEKVEKLDDDYVGAGSIEKFFELAAKLVALEGASIRFEEVVEISAPSGAAVVRSLARDILNSAAITFGFLISAFSIRISASSWRRYLPQIK